MILIFILIQFVFGNLKVYIAPSLDDEYKLGDLMKEVAKEGINKYNKQIDSIINNHRNMLKQISDESIKNDSYLKYVDLINKVEKSRLKKFEHYLQHRKPFNFMKIGQLKQSMPENKYDKFFKLIKSNINQNSDFDINEYKTKHEKYIQHEAVKKFKPTVDAGTKLIQK